MAPFLTVIEQLEHTSNNPNGRGVTFVAHTEPSLINRLGTIFGIVELIALNDLFGDKLLDIIRDLETEYYLPPFNIDESTESRFEQCLQRANRRLQKIIQESPDRVNIENIGAVLGLIHQDKVHLSYTGGVNAFLFHRRKRYDHAIIDILGQATDKRQPVTPEKIFSNIIAGTISEKDDVFICNNTILEYIAQSELATTIADKAPLVAVQALEQQLLETAGDGNNFFALIISPRRAQAPAEEAAPLPHTLQPQHSINRLMTTQAKTEQYLTPSMMPSWKKVLILFLGFAQTAGTAIWKYTVTGATWTLRTLRRSSKRLVHRAQTRARATSMEHHPEPQPAPLKQTPAPQIEAVNIVEIERDADSIEITDIITEVELENPEGKPSEEVINPIANIVAREEVFDDEITTATPPKITRSIKSGTLPYISDKLNQGIGAFMALTRQQKILLVAGFIFFFIFSQSIVWKGQGSTIADTGNTQQTIQQIEDFLNTAEAQNVFNDEDGARASLAQAEELFNTLPDRRTLRDERMALQKKFEQLKQSLEKITVIDNLNVLADLGKTTSNINPRGFTVGNNTLWTIDNANNTLNLIKRDNGEITSFLLGDANKFTNVVAISEARVALLSEQKQVFIYDTGSKVLTPIIEGQPITALGIYGDRLYTLQPERNQIYRHLPVDNSFNSGASWLRESADLGNAKALTIDGSIYIASESGAITNYLSGRKQATEFAPLDTPLKPTAITTAAEANYVYVLDPENKRVVVYDKKGALKTQFTSKSWDTLQGLALVETQKKLYILADNRVVVIDIAL
jgi:hypothetical protein